MQGRILQNFVLSEVGRSVTRCGKLKISLQFIYWLIPCTTLFFKIKDNNKIMLLKPRKNPVFYFGFTGSKKKKSIIIIIKIVHYFLYADLPTATECT